MIDAITQCLSCFVACVGFAFIFRIHYHLSFALIASFGGTLGYITYLLCVGFNNTFIACFIAMVIVALFSEIAARVKKAPATIFLIIGCFPLVPGRGIYETMLYCVRGNTTMFIQSLIDTIAVSMALALAILIVSTIFKIFKKLKYQRQKRVMG